MYLSNLFVLVSGLTCASGFVPRFQDPVFTTARLAKEDDGEVKLAQALSVGSLVEFVEKSRVHIGTIVTSEHKSSGGARYKVEDAETGKRYDIPDKAISFSTPAPTSPSKCEKLLTELAAAQKASEFDLCEQLDVSPDLIEMAWEEAAAEEATVHQLTPKSFVKLVQGHAASAIEEYMAWKLLRGDMAHVFFKDIKQNGRICAFKAKARKAVENAKAAFCSSHRDDIEFCFV